MGLDLASGPEAGFYPSSGGIGLAAAPEAAPVIRETDATNAPIPTATPAAPLAVPTPQTAGNGIPQFKDDPIGAIGVVLGNIGAGLQGKPLPSDTMMAQHRQNQALQLSMVKTGIDALTHIIGVSENLPATERKKFLDAQGAQFEKVLPGFKAQLDAFATQPDSGDLAKLLGDYKDDITALANGSPTKIREILKNPEMMKIIRESADLRNTPTAIAKIGDIQKAIGASPTAQAALPKGPDGKPQVTMATLERWNAQQPDGSPLKLSGGELAAVRNNPDRLREVGVTPAADLKVAAEASATATAQRSAEAATAGQIAAAKAGAERSAEAATAGQIAAAQADAAVPAKKTFEEFKINLEKQKEIEVNAAKLKAKDPQNEFKNANTLRDEYNNLSKDYRVVQDAYGKIVSAGASKTNAGDMAMMYAYIKMLDPQTGVREGEYATAQNTGTIPQKIVTAYNKAVNGEGMDDAQRQDMLAQAKGLYAVHEKGQDRIVSEYTRIAKKNGIDPTDVIVDVNRTAGAAPKAPAVGEARDGYRFKGGNPALPGSWEKL